MYMTDTTLGITKPWDYLSVEFSPELTVTEHPVEFGGEVSDHVQKRPLRFVVDVIVTSTPRGLPDPGAIDNAYAFLQQAEGHPLVIVLTGEGAGTYTNVFIEAYPSRKDASKGRTFAIRFREVRIAFGLSVAIPVQAPAPVAAVGAPDETKLGQQAPTAAPDQSIMYQGATSLYNIGAAILGAPEF
jgi:hypothetical protein